MPGWRHVPVLLPVVGFDDITSNCHARCIFISIYKKKNVINKILQYINALSINAGACAARIDISNVNEYIKTLDGYVVASLEAWACHGFESKKWHI